MQKTNIVLVGFMGTGKTSVAKKIAKKCENMTLVDMDALIAEREGRSINAFSRLTASRISAISNTNFQKNLLKVQIRSSQLAAELF